MNRKLDAGGYNEAISQKLLSNSPNGREALQTLITIHFDIKVLNLQLRLLYCIPVSSKQIYGNRIQWRSIFDETRLPAISMPLLWKICSTSFGRFGGSFNLQGWHCVTKRRLYQTQGHFGASERSKLTEFVVVLYAALEERAINI